jgi:hypothetical protein
MDAIIAHVTTHWIPAVLGVTLIVGLTFLKLLPYIETDRERRKRQEEMD